MSDAAGASPTAGSAGSAACKEGRLSGDGSRLERQMQAAGFVQCAVRVLPLLRPLYVVLRALLLEGGGCTAGAMQSWVGTGCGGCRQMEAPYLLVPLLCGTKYVVLRALLLEGGGWRGPAVGWWAAGAM